MTKQTKTNTYDHDKFAVFILSHGRADNVVTLASLLRAGYTGRYYIVIDNEDDMAPDYYEKYGDATQDPNGHIVMFDKPDIAKRFDTMHNFGKRNTIVYARNACFEIAASLGIERFLQLDDDYVGFMYRFPDGPYYSSKLVNSNVTDFDRVCGSMLRFLDTSGALTVCFAQGGDFIGGLNGMYLQKVKRKGMNAFFCNTDRPMNFIGHINEDVNTYVTRSNRGDLIMTVTDIMLNQVGTQVGKGGMTAAYLDSGTYYKSIYTPVALPSAAHVAMLNSAHPRIHHKINWNNCAPKILNERYKKPTEG